MVLDEHDEGRHTADHDQFVMAKTWPFMRHRSRQSVSVESLHPLTIRSAFPIIAFAPALVEKN